MVHTYRHARVPMLVAALALSAISLFTASAKAQPGPSGPPSQPLPAANSHWQWCNAEAVKSTPSVLWARIQSATTGHSDLPATFWTSGTYRDDIAKIVCYESSFNYHASNVGQYGWFQMNQPLIASEGVTWSHYWSGSLTEHPGWYQCTAGERYIHSRYRNPAIAWLHEEVYGWY